MVRRSSVVASTVRYVRGTQGSLFGPAMPVAQSEPPHFCNIAAVTHHAPSTAVVFGGVQEEPSAGLASALSHASQKGGAGQQLGGRAGDGAKRLVERMVGLGPSPMETLPGRPHAQAPELAAQFTVQLIEVGRLRRLVRCQRDKDPIDRFSQADG